MSCLHTFLIKIYSAILKLSLLCNDFLFKYIIYNYYNLARTKKQTEYLNNITKYIIIPVKVYLLLFSRPSKSNGTLRMESFIENACIAFAYKFK